MANAPSTFLPSFTTSGLVKAAGAAVALLLCDTSPATAVLYDVSHQFRLQPAGTLVPLTFHHFRTIAQVRENGALVADTSVPQGSVAFVGISNIPAAPNPAVGASGSFADANSQATLNAPPAAGQAVQGTVRAYGETVAQTAPGINSVQTRAFSASQVEARGGRQLGNGRIVWKPVFSSVAAGGPGLFVDPIFFDVFAPSGALIAHGDLLDIHGDVAGPGSQIIWDDFGNVNINALSAHFSIDIPGTFTLEEGALLLEIVGGIVTVSQDSGMFDGLLPAVGSPGNFSFNAAPAIGITLNYETGFFSDTDDGTQISINFANAGEANDEANDGSQVPEPATLALFGTALIGFGLISRRQRRRDQR